MSSHIKAWIEIVRNVQSFLLQQNLKIVLVGL